MLAIQLAIGALNDRVDAPRDATVKPRKPIAAGLARTNEALWLAVVAGVAGLALSGWSGVPTLVVAAAGLALGIAYDLRLSVTRWSWVPLALALPLLPVHAWVGATGEIPASLAPLFPAGILAGAALALSNGLVDVERDAATGRVGAVVTLGAWRAWWLHIALLAAVIGIAVLVAPEVRAGEPASGLASAGWLSIDTLRLLRIWAVVLGTGALVIGAAALGLGRPSLRERGWELEAIGMAGIGLGWLAGVAGSTGGGAA